ncbi:MAG: aminotransferase class V-fold PLP-dependent enzyme [Saprospiraceae bacterium]|nr:aminotransferase class V-fold PLP-dependent enzyme [Saprospiraceae bacterium]
MINRKKMIEETLDPKDWEEMRAIGHLMMDDMIDYLKDIKDKPVWKPIPEETKTFFKEELPEYGMNAKEIYAQFKTHILPYNKGNIHPRFWAWVQGTGTPMGVFGDFLASAMNPNVTIGEQSPMYVDQEVVNWCKQMMHFPESASGILLSGGSMANTTALIVARNHMIAFSRKEGMQGLALKPVMYCSSETHSCIAKAAEVIGVGTEGLRKISVNADYTINLESLEQTIRDDISKGYNPFCLVGNAGTVNTGAIDDLKALKLLCKKYDLWFHIDGAFGALAKLTDQYKEKLKPIEEADSVAFDLHKWMYMPYEVGCVLIRNKEAHRNAFSFAPNYLMTHEGGLASGPDSFNNFGIELSRGFKALKVWMSIKEQGIKKYAEQIQKNIQQAEYLTDLVNENNTLELLAPTSLNIVCFRFVSSNKTKEELNQLNKDIVMKLQVSGIASPSSTILGGNYAIRVAITNHRSITSDFDLLINETIKLGNSLL